MNDQAFVLQGYGSLSGTVYIRTEPSEGFYQLSQRYSDYVYYGASALAHEESHLFARFNEKNAFYVQDMVFHEFKNYFQNPGLYGGLDESLHQAIKEHSRDKP